MSDQLTTLTPNRFAHTYVQPDAPDPVLDNALVLELARRHVPRAGSVTGVDESGGEARTYCIDDDVIVKVQRPQQLRPLTSLEREVVFLGQLEAVPGVSVPRVLGYGREGQSVEYTVMTRMPGRAMRHVDLDPVQHDEVMVRLGATLRRIHTIPQEPFRQEGLFPADESFDVVLDRFKYYFAAVVNRIRDRRVAWNLDPSPGAVADVAVSRLPPSDETVALHSNPGPEHTFVFPDSGAYSGLIDFGDTFISHPALDLRRRSGVRDRAAIMRGYTAEGETSETFQETWKIVQILSDMTDIAVYPDRAPAATDDLKQLLKAIR